MTTIKTIGNLHELVPIAQKFATDQGSAFHEAKFLSTLNEAQRADHFYLGLYDGPRLVGALLAVKLEEWYSNVTVATELGWYVEEAYRKGTGPYRMLMEFLQWAGDDPVRISYRHRGVNLGPMYERLGFHPSETVYEKRNVWPCSQGLPLQPQAQSKVSSI